MVTLSTMIYVYTSHLTPDKNAMATYSDGKFLSPEKNFQDFYSKTRLAGATYSNYAFNYVKHAKTLDIKVPLDESKVLGNENYCIIKNNYNIASTSTEYERAMCYFITDKKWVSAGTLLLHLECDVLNSFADLFDSDYLFSSLSKVERCHKDRFLNSAISGIYNDDDDYFYLTRKVDETSEGLPIPVKTTTSKPTDLYLRNSHEKKKGQYAKWLLVYMQDPGTSGTDPKIGIAAIPKVSHSFVKSTGDTVTLSSGVTVNRSATSIYQIIEIPYAPFYDSHYSTDTYYWSDAYSATNEKLRWTYKDFAGNNDSGISSCLWMDVVQWANIGYESALINNDQLSFMDVLIPGKANRKTAVRNQTYESKLYHSDFYTYKYLFDSYSTTVRPESIYQYDYTSTQQSAFSNPSVANAIRYYQSIQGGSSLMFGFEPTTLYGSVKYKNSTDYEQYLVSNRDLKSPLVTSALATYLRTGYYYDQKSLDMQNQQAGYNTVYAGVTGALTATGQGAGFAASVASENVGGAVSSGLGLTKSVLSIYKNAEDRVYQQNMRENSLRAKLAGIESQGMSVRNNNDLGLFEVYGGECLQKAVYTPTIAMRDALFEYFHIAGYYSPETTDPTRYFNTRRSFNFIKFSPVFNDVFAVPNKLSIFAEDLKDRCNAGITIFHEFNVNGTAIIDWTQAYENWEIWLCDRS